MAEGRMYHIGDEQFTPAQFRELPRARQVEAMVEWFHAHFEDPVNSTSYNGREGGYLWDVGGPYDADEELQGQFSDIADFDDIQEAVQRVTRDGTYEWASVRSAYTDFDYDNDLRLREGEIVDGDEEWPPLVAVEVEPEDFRTELLQRMERLEAAIAPFGEGLPPRNHNHPPELVEEEPLTAQQLQEVRRAIEELRAETQRERADEDNLRTQASVLRRIAGAVLGWLARKADAAVDGVIQWAAPIGAAYVYANPQEVQAALNAVADTATAWAQQLSGLL